MRTPHRAIVLGLGRFGGGVGVARYFAARGVPVVVVDRLDEGALEASIAQLAPYIEDGLVTLLLNSDELPELDDRDLIVVNPAVPTPWVNEQLQAARRCGVGLSTEIELTIGALMERGGPELRIVAITGSNGKSTTTAMIGSALQHLGHSVVVGGNLGGSLLADLDRVTPSTLIVLELSSAMLWWLGASEAFCPTVGVVTNFVANHLDWHGTEEHYRASKQILSRQTQRAVILGPGVHDWPVAADARRVLINAEARVKDLRVPGRHNELNAACALAAIEALELDRDSAFEEIRRFPGLPHRLSLVGTFGGVLCYDDSKSTTPDATVLAISALREAGIGRIHLIAGGYDKQISLDAITSEAAELATLAAIGATAPALCGSGGMNCQTLERAVETVMSRARPGDAVLLSPGCASWDQFTNFMERGQRFAELVRSYER